ncbi:hypothetical protein ARAM_004687 [Aspergillus rambellii]|uniref:SUN domain-containing protein n=1 Tax=Aspergillus rambellii TaxID=308745 RepID=A0A0F8WCH1_9EURO|nr:hypothetical protein ARAM_004687 [Aspergillus rambellii]
MLAAKPKMNLVEMASTIEDAIQVAKDREQNEAADSPGTNTRTRKKSASPSALPVRRLRREPTPDQIQLLDSLREITNSPVRRANLNETRQSTATPTPPIRHTFSTTSSPGNTDITIQNLYPPSLERLNSSDLSNFSPDSPQGLAVDNESVISWVVERDIHDDALRRTRSKRPQEDPQGKHISAPPRRFSGLAFAHETIQEEEEPDSRIQEPSRISISPEPQIVPEPTSAPAKTIIPDRFIREPSSQEESSILSKVSLRNKPRKEKIHREGNEKRSWDLLFQIAILTALTITTMFAIHTFKDKLFQDDSDFKFEPTPHIPLNESNADALNSLSHQMVRLGAHVSSLSKEVKVMKTEVSNIPAPTTILQQYMPRMETPKTNFLSVGLGVIIDPYMTSPTAGPTRDYLQALYMWIARKKHRSPQPPRAALTPWEDVGECWCSTPREGMSQFAALLGRQIVPEEVVVEHMPKSATIRPEVAPKDMELWARFQYVGKDSSLNRSIWSRVFFSAPENVSGQDSLVPDRKVLHGPVMKTLRLAFPGDVESSYYNDKLLGPDFYRIGKWSYNIDDPYYAQKFTLDAIIDSDEIRVDKVVFRVKSNWGGNNTCIYRLKLYGRM